MSLSTLLIMALAASQASAASTSAPSTRITKPDWVGRPSGEDYMAALSQSANAREMSGWALMKCHVSAKGSLQDCNVIADGPNGYGFDKTALKLSTRFRMKPVALDGRPVAGGTILLPFLFGSPSMGHQKMSYAPGQPSFLLTPIAKAKRGATVVACPSAKNPNLACQADQLYWKVSPALEETAPIVASAKQTTGTSVAYCKILDGKISGTCQMQGENNPLALAAASKTLMKLGEPRLKNGDPVSAGIVAVVYDWDSLSEAADAIIAADDKLGAPQP